MTNSCQPILINNLYGLLKINTTDYNPLCSNIRQWYFYSNYGYTLLLRLINLTSLITNSCLLKIYSIKNNDKFLVYDLESQTKVNNEFQLNFNESNSGILIELIFNENKTNSLSANFFIDYVFRGKNFRKTEYISISFISFILDISRSRFGRQILQDNSSSSSFNSSQPAFIALLCIIAVLLVAIIITIAILLYRYCSQRHKQADIFCRSRRISADQAHLTTPSSGSSYSIRSTQQLFPAQSHQTTDLHGQSQSTLPSIVPSHRLQQSMIDAYLNDYNSFHRTNLDPKQLHKYLFVDLHSTSSETYPERNSKKISYDNNTTTSGYDTSTGGEDRNYKHTFRYQHRRRYHHRSIHQQIRQRRRSTLAFKRAHGARFLMRERSLPSTLLKLPQLRQPNPLLHFQDQHSSSTISTNPQDFISTNLSDSTEVSSSNSRSKYSMKIVNEQTKPSVEQPTPICFFEKVSTHRGDDSDMPNYESLPRSHHRNDRNAFVNESIIV